MRYIIGVDLGTTNSCVSYVDTNSKGHPSLAVQQFKIPQLTSGHHLAFLPVLPSFCYLSGEEEFTADALKLPWKNSSLSVVGSLGQELGMKVPNRIIHSAKSWLCHSAVDRQDKILPIEMDPKRRMSPVEATATYLSHLKEAWNFVMAKDDSEKEWEQQDIVLTVPASFDEIARRLTVEGCHLAGFSNITLLEEPQAAFYSWIAQHESSWTSYFKAGHVILVCDVGGGTTDFSLIEVQEKDGVLSFQRMAVGNHLLLGGDNMDIAIAHHLEKKLRSQGLPELMSSQWWQLRQEARLIKENLGEDVDSHFRLFIQGSGSSVLQGGMALEGDRSEILQLLLDGFFGQCSWAEALSLKKASGLKSLGLPYEEDPSIVKHLAYFLQTHCQQSMVKAPDFVLFNGGTMKLPFFQEAILENLKLWFPHQSPQILDSISLDLAVARGAAYYGKARKGLGVKIGGGIPRTYYLEVDQNKSDQNQAMVILPRGCEEGERYEWEQTFWTKPNTPVSFKLFSSHVRLSDQLKELVPVNLEEMNPLPPIHTILRVGKGTAVQNQEEKIPVKLEIHLSAIGTLELLLKSQKTSHKWLLEFQLRTLGGHEEQTLASTSRFDESFDMADFQKGKQVIEDAFKGQKIKPLEILNKLEETLERPRLEWSPSILRGLWPTLLSQAAYRKVSVDHEARWWNLAGFFLRPGFGYPLDDHRLKDLWKIVLSDLKDVKHPNCIIQRWICYRRIGGGLSKGQQMQLTADMVSSLLPKKGAQLIIKGSAELYQYTEKMRAIASMELLESALKIQVGNALIHRIQSGEAISADFWALGRIGSRHLLYGSLAHVIPSSVCSQWVQSLLAFSPNKDQEEHWLFALTQLGRKTDHREINLNENLISKIIEQGILYVEEKKLRTLLENYLSLHQKQQIFGDHLPPGLSFKKP